jgi:shikimate kinase
MMGVGKSSVGRCLRRRTGLNFLDTDEIIASSFGMSIPRIFDEHGEKKFREAETEVLRRMQTEDQTIIVTGGGIVLRKENVEMLEARV